ncbi:MAG: glycoside hydrolase family 1 protein [Terriglobales bacterium]
MNEMDFGSASPEAPLQFPEDFLWGVSTAAHQVEGDNCNQWSDWELAGRIRSGDKCGKACDWWENAERDFDIACDLGMKALRLSLEWSRIEPEEGSFDPTALQRYRQMLEGLHQRGIEPIVCLHHFTNPRWFERRGAFLRTDAPQLFERFTREVAKAVGDLCRFWVTFNEPNVYAACGYVLGEFPPGHKGQLLNALRVNRIQARAHVLAYRAIHEMVPEARVGWAQHYVVFEPVPGRASRWVAGLLDLLFNHTFLDLIESGRFGFPFGLLKGREEEAKGCCDFVGLNVYSRFHVAFDVRRVSTFFANVFVPPHVPQGDPGVDRPYGEAYPQAIRQAVERAARLGKPIYIMENGVPDAADQIRPWLIVNVLRELHGLIAQHYDIRGYLHWTLTDNFEWNEGWKLRFGLVALDPETQHRTMRSSAKLFSEIIRDNGLPVPAAEPRSPLSTILP